MAFLDKEHKKEIEFLKEKWNSLKDLEELAQKKRIPDIFQDNGAKVLQQVILSGMDFLPGREGNDAVDVNGVEWEFKSINIATSATGFSTYHHSTLELLDRFNSVPWLFSVYEGIHLQEMYVLSPGQLNEWVTKQKNNLEKKIQEGKANSLNNPKIPLKYVKANGTQVYPFAKDPIDPASLDGKNNK